jgi:hypothetical protein
MLENREFFLADLLTKRRADAHFSLTMPPKADIASPIVRSHKRRPPLFSSDGLFVRDRSDIVTERAFSFTLGFLELALPLLGFAFLI